MTVNYKFHTTPYAHQRRALDLSLTRPYFAFFMEMGTGKSKVLVDTMVNLFLRGEIDFALIVAPKGVYGNWVHKELVEHVSPDIPMRVIQWHPSPNQKQTAEMRSVGDPFDGLTVFVMNTEAFSTPKGHKAGLWLARKFGKRGLIGLDESTSIKKHSAKRTQALIQVACHMRYRRILTGSPSTRSPMDLWSQAEFLRAGLLGHSFFSFQAQYATLIKRRLRVPKKSLKTGRQIDSFKQVVGYRNLDQLSREIREWSYRVMKDECLDLPEKIYTVREVELTAVQKRHYNTLRSSALALLDSGTVVAAPMAMTKLLRLQQVVCGHLPDEETGEIVEFDSGRAAAVVEIASETEENIIIWCRFINDIDRVRAALAEEFGPETVVTYDGRTSSADRQTAIETLNDPHHPARFFVGNAQTGGRGITLTSASVVIYFSNSFDLEARMQSEDRAHRIGQKKNVTYIDLVSTGTIDEKIIHALRNKMVLSAQTLGEEMREWLKLKP
jgi:SNF2 family DNA or RNA helicase